MDYRSILKSIITKAPGMADESMEVGDDILNMMGKSGREMNAEFADDAARAARQADIEDALSNPIEQIPYENLSNKSAQESAGVLAGAPNEQLQIGMEALPVPSKGLGMTRKPPVMPDDVLPPEFPIAPRPQQSLVSDAPIDVTPQSGMSAFQKMLLGSGAAGLAGSAMYAANQGGGEQPPAVIPPRNKPIDIMMSGDGQAPDLSKAPGAPGKAPAQLSVPVQGMPEMPQQPTSVEDFAKPTFDSEGFTNNTVQNLQAAQDQASQGRLANELGRASEIIGSSIAGTKPVAQDIFNAQIKDSDKPVKSFEERAEKEKADPKSAISQQFRDFMGKLGVTVPANMSAEAAAKVMPYAYQKFAAKEAQTARAFEAGENRKLRETLSENALSARQAAASEKAATGLTDKQNKFAQTIAPKVQNKQYEKFAKLEQARLNIEHAVNNPNPQSDSALIYDFIKSLDPDSAVREGEISFVGTARSIPTKTKALVNKMFKGELLTPDERKNILDFATQSTANQKKAWEISAKPYINQAEKMGVDLSLIIPEMAEYGPSAEAPSKKPATIERGKDSRDIPAKDSDGKPGKIVKETPKFTTPESDPRVDNFMKKNGISNRNEAIRILKEAGKI
jgi:hypothetical protein